MEQQRYQVYPAQTEMGVCLTNLNLLLKKLIKYINSFNQNIIKAINLLNVNVIILLLQFLLHTGICNFV